jgi:hypothetical protein
VWPWNRIAKGRRLRAGAATGVDARFRGHDG